jgi:tRNA (adenine22-N1)-methyltransferase
MELKGRLKRIVDLIPEVTVLSDIGTDHAYIPIYAVQKGICRKAVASDLRAGPVKTAAKNVERHKLADRIEVRLGGGLQPIGHDELEAVVIAGMGGLLITEILEESINKAKAAGLLILQPMNAVEAVREYLYGKGFEITDERLAAEENKIYNILCVRWTGSITAHDEFDCYIGSKLLGGREEYLDAYLKKRLGQLETAIAGMEKAKEEPESLAEFRSIRKRLFEVMK